MIYKIPVVEEAEKDPWRKGGWSLKEEMIKKKVFNGIELDTEEGEGMDLKLIELINIKLCDMYI